MPQPCLLEPARCFPHENLSRQSCISQTPKQRLFSTAPVSAPAPSACVRAVGAGVDAAAGARTGDATASAASAAAAAAATAAAAAAAAATAAAKAWLWHSIAKQLEPSRATLVYTATNQ